MQIINKNILKIKMVEGELKVREKKIIINIVPSKKK